VNGLFGGVVYGLCVVLGAYSVAFVVLSWLPDAATIALVVFSGSSEVARALQGDRPLSYWDALAKLTTFAFGKSLDGIDVFKQIRSAAQVSAPLTLFALVAMVFTATATTRLSVRRPLNWVLGYVLALPAFLPIVLISATGILLGIDSRNWILAAVASSIVPCVIVASTLNGLMTQELARPYALAHKARGATPAELRTLLTKNVAAAALPSLHGVLVALWTSQLFAEHVANIGGIGSLTIRAIQRNDVALALPLISLYAVTLAALSILVRAMHRLLDHRLT
jgi:ABC-type dipeptide/oligopeptide/nickel transport system permease component